MISHAIASMRRYTPVNQPADNVGEVVCEIAVAICEIVHRAPPSTQATIAARVAARLTSGLDATLPTTPRTLLAPLQTLPIHPSANVPRIEQPVPVRLPISPARAAGGAGAITGAGVTITASDAVAVTATSASVRRLGDILKRRKAGGSGYERGRLRAGRGRGRRGRTRARDRRPRSSSRRAAHTSVQVAVE